MQLALQNVSLLCIISHCLLFFTHNSDFHSKNYKKNVRTVRWEVTMTFLCIYSFISCGRNKLTYTQQCIFGNIRMLENYNCSNDYSSCYQIKQNTSLECFVVSVRETIKKCWRLQRDWLCFFCSSVHCVFAVKISKHSFPCLMGNCLDSLWFVFNKGTVMFFFCRMWSLLFL